MKKEKKKGNGRVCKLVQAYLDIVTCIGCVVGCILFYLSTDNPIIGVSCYGSVALFMLVLAILQFLFAYKLRDSKGANTACIVINAILTPCYLLGLAGLIGGIKWSKRLKEAEKQGAGQAVPSAIEPTIKAQAEVPVQQNSEHAETKTLADYPIDYENKPTASRLLDMNNSEPFAMQNEEDTIVEFEQLFVTIYRDNLYAVMQTIGLSEEEGGGVVIFQIDYEKDLFYVEDDDAVCESVYNLYEEALNNEVGKQQIKRSEFKLDLYDASIDEKTWKEFKKRATQEELCIIAIGAKYRIAHGRILNLLYALGIILSIALFYPTDWFSLIGYPIFAFFATKAIRYEDTFNQSYHKLNKENKAFVDNFFNVNFGLALLDAIVNLAVFWLTIPYQGILMLIGMFAPNFVISKNGILVPIPKGYDVGDLGAIGAYYNSFSFLDETMEHLPQNSGDAYTFTNDLGCEQTVYSKDGKHFYDKSGELLFTREKEQK